MGTYENLETHAISMTPEVKGLIVKLARETKTSVSGYVRRYILEPWYIEQISQCNKLTVYLEGDARIIKVEIDNVPTES